MKYINADEFERDCMFDRNCEDMQDVIYKLRDYPPADVAEIKHGEWIIKKTSIFREKITYTRKQIAHCPYCGHMEDRKIPKFCSECGADMRERKDSE